MQQKGTFSGVRSIVGMAVVLFAGMAPLMAQATRTLKVAGEKQSQCRFRNAPFTPLQNGGLLLSPEDGDSAKPVLCVMGAGGNREEITVAVPDAKRIRVSGAAAGQDGAIAIAGVAHKGSGLLPYLLLLAPDHKQSSLVDLTPYFPDAVTVAADGTIWMAGFERRPNGIPVENYKVIRRYDTSGKLLDSYLPKNKFPKAVAAEPSDESRLVASRDRVGWYPRTVELKGQYVEFDLKGDEMGRYKIAPLEKEQRVSGVAMSPQNDLVVARSVEGKTELVTLDRKEKNWNPVVLPGAATFQMLGFNGMTLVVTPDSLATLRSYEFEGSPSR